MRRVSRFVLLLATIVPLVGLVPATAATMSAAPASPNGSAITTQPPNDHKAGYAAQPASGELRRASATFVVPELSCRGRHDGINLGLTSEPTRTHRKYLAVVATQCWFGNPSLDLRVFVADSQQYGDAAEGDRVRVSVRREPGGVVRVRAKNLTTGVVVRAEGDPGHYAERHVVEFGAFSNYAGGGTNKPVPKFDRVRFGHVTITGDAGPVCVADTDPVKNTRVDDETGKLEIDVTDFAEPCTFDLVYESH